MKKKAVVPVAEVPAVVVPTKFGRGGRRKRMRAASKARNVERIKAEQAKVA